MVNIEYLRQSRNYYSQFAAIQLALQGKDIEDFYMQVTEPIPYIANAYKYAMAYEYSKHRRVFDLSKPLEQTVDKQIIELYAILPIKLLAGAKAVADQSVALATTNLFSEEFLQSMYLQINRAAYVLSEYIACFNSEQMKTNPDASIRIIGSYNKEEGFCYVLSCGFTNCEKELFTC